MGVDVKIKKEHNHLGTIPIQEWLEYYLRLLCDHFHQVNKCFVYKVSNIGLASLNVTNHPFTHHLTFEWIQNTYVKNQGGPWSAPHLCECIMNHGSCTLIGDPKSIQNKVVTPKTDRISRLIFFLWIRHWNLCIPISKLKGELMVVKS